MGPDRGARSGRCYARSRPLPPERNANMLPGPLLVSLLLCGSAPDGPGAIAQTPAPAQTPAARRSVGESQAKPVPKGEPASKGQGAPRARGAGATRPAGASRPTAPPAGRIRAPKGFRVDLLYSVPRETQGSWVNMTVDPKGRLIVSDQYGKLYRVTLPPIGGKAEGLRIEPIDAPIGEAHGLLWAFDSLYVVVNRGRRYDSGLYRVRDTDGDDRLDKVELLRKLNGGGEHGPHAVILAPDGRSLYVVAGNATQLPQVTGSLVPQVWGEDNLLPRMVDGSGFMADEKAPGGYICRVSPDGQVW